MKVTIFTPTYNRGYLIEQLYLSLKSQTCKDFEWLVVDDGSTDHTINLFDKWIFEDNHFEITYIKTKNGGKHRAINRGVEIARGELFFIVDSDDYLISNAIERIVFWEASIKDEMRFAGVSGNRGYNENEIIGQTFDGEFVDATALERDKLNIIGDKSEVFYTEVLKQYKFPEFEGENFITENIVWLAIANDGYKMRWFNEIIYITHYLEDGLTQHALEIAQKNQKGYALYYKKYQEYYSNYLKVEKDRVFSLIKDYLFTGDLKKADDLLSENEAILSQDESFVLLKYQIYLYEGDYQKAINYLERSRKASPNHLKVIEKLEEIYLNDGNRVALINLYQDYLYVLENRDKENELINKLETELKVDTDDIRFVFDSKLKALIQENNISEAVRYFMSGKLIDPQLKDELQFYENNGYIQLFILLYYFKSVIGYPIQESFSSYLYGQTYYLYGQYANSYEAFKHIPNDERSPMVKARIDELKVLLK